jgi:hypothetical protein
MNSLPSKVNAQSYRETADFIFSLASINRVFKRNTDANHVDTQGCIIRVSSEQDWVVVNFDKLIISSGVISKDSLGSMTITVEGDQDAVTDFADYYRGGPSMVREKLYHDKLEVVIPGVAPDSAMGGRIAHAFQYFTSNFCSGKKSAF